MDLAVLPPGLDGDEPPRPDEVTRISLTHFDQSTKGAF
jgi:hypothetical protein